jgi:hypothetical protein
MDTLWQDLRYGVRLLARSPGFTLVTVLTLAIGIGANTTIVSVANALLVRPLPVREPDTLVRAFSGRYSGTSLIDLLDYARASKTLQGIAPFREATLSLRTGSALEPLFGELVGGDDFDLVGVPAARGRTFLPYEGRAPRATLIARVDGDPIAAAPAIHDVLRQLDPDLPVFETRALREATSISLLPIWMAATFLGLLGPARARAGRDRTVWRAVVPRAAADEGDWHPHGARRGSFARGAHRHARRGALDGLGRWCRPAARAAGHAARRELAVRRPSSRHPHLRGLHTP